MVASDMDISYLSLGILIIALGASFVRGRFFANGGEYFANQPRMNLANASRIISTLKSGYQYIFYGSVFLIFTLLFYQSYGQYRIWSQNEVSRFLLPPHQSIGYFIFYVSLRFFASYLASLAVALIFVFAAQFLNRKYEERFFYPEEPWMGAIALFLIGHPGWLFYSALLIIIYLVIHIFSSLISRFSSRRLSLYYLWIPTGIFVIIVSRWFQDLSLWQILKI